MNPKKIFLLPFVALVFLSACTKRTKACFTYELKPVNDGTNIELNPACSQSSYIFDWSFGDGSDDTTTHDISIVEHVFTAPGTYTVHLHTSRKDGWSLGKGKPDFYAEVEVP